MAHRKADQNRKACTSLLLPDSTLVVRVFLYPMNMTLLKQRNGSTKLVNTRNQLLALRSDANEVRMDIFTEKLWYYRGCRAGTKVKVYVG